MINHLKPQIQRILGFCNFNKEEKTFGCCDRNYWHYRLLDLSNSRYQEVGLMLSILYCNQIDQLFYKNSIVKEYLRGVIEFWLKRRNKDGSCVEVYPNERSYCATSFSTYSLLYSMYILDDLYLTELYLDEFKKTIEWLGRNKSVDTPNQMAGAAAAMCIYSKLTGDPAWQSTSVDIFNLIKPTQASSGAIEEYGGPDAGYTTITISALVVVYKITGYPEVLELIDKAISFIEKITDSSGRYDPTPYSRQTQFVYPRAFAFRKSIVYNKLLNGINENKVLNPSWMDDRYCLPLTIDYLLSEVENSKC